MAFERLSESVRTLYAELLEQTIHAEAEAAALGVPSAGSFVKKEVKGRTYFYLQVSEGERRRQHYLGPDSPALREWMERVREARETTSQDEAGRARLCKMLKRGGGRDATWRAKAQKDLWQAGQLLEVLLEKSPGDVVVAWEALAEEGGALRGVLRAVEQLEASVRGRLLDEVPMT